MKAEKILLCVFLATQITLAWAVSSGARALRGLDRADTRREESLDALAENLRLERVHLAAERSRLEQRVERLAETLRASWRSPVASAKATEIAADDAQFLANSAEELGLLDERLSTIDTPLLSVEERAELSRRRDAIPLPRPSHQTLLWSSVEEIAADAEWNSAGRELTAEELERLRALVADYRYFSRQAHHERILEQMKPLIPEMLAAGAYVEYAEGTEVPPVPRFDGRLVMSISGASEEQGKRRLFYFYPDEFPELYHQHQVESERSLEAYVEIAELFAAGK